DILHSCLDQIEEMIVSEMREANAAQPASSAAGQAAASSAAQSKPDPPSDKTIEHSQAGTPTDVRDVHF
ncbi:hypothetical protein LSTR_LSTR017220, partial [Laodelphax striatellus]